jgi:RNA polymerase sigma factor (sigma-70 family)
MPIFRERPNLIECFRKGERDALEQVYRAYVEKVAAIARFGFRLPGAGTVPGLAANPADVADAVQDVFVKVFAPAARASFDGQREFGPYLYAITRNVVVDRCRLRGRELPTPKAALEQAHEALSPAPEESGPWADAATVAAVRRYLDALDGPLRRLHRVRYVEGLSQRDAADRLGITRQVLRTLEDKLRDGLRTELARPR